MAVAVECDVLLSGYFDEGVYGLVYEVFYVDGGWLDLFAFLLQSAEVQELVDQPEQVFGAEEDVVQLVLDCCVGGAVDE